MQEPDPLSHLNALDAALHESLRPMPTLLSTIAQRYRDAVPGPLGEVPLDQLYLDEAPLTHHLCFLALGRPLPAGDVQRLVVEGFEAIGEQHSQWVRRFLLQSGPDLRQLHMDALKRFWAFTKINQQPLRQWLNTWCRAHLLGQARLRYADRTFDDWALRLVTRLASEPDASGPRPWQGAIILHNGPTRWALPGAFVICEGDPHRLLAQPVVLSTLTQGLETFESLAVLYQELAERLEDDRQGPALLAALDPERQYEALRCNALTFEPLTGDLFTFLQSSLEARQQAAVTQAWENARPHFELRDLDAASYTLAEAAKLYTLLSSQGPRLTRYALLLERDTPAWMRTLSQQQRLELMQHIRELGLATANAIAPGLPSLHTFADPERLHQYARGQLIALLRRHGVTLSPERIIISVTSSEAGGPLVHPLNPSASVPVRVPEHTSPPIILTTTTRTLVQLAIQNISPLDWDYLLTARVYDHTGAPVPGLTAAKVRQIVRRANVSGGYGRYLLSRLRYGPEAEWRRERHARLLRAKLRLEALKAYHRGQLGPGGLGWNWISSVIASPTPAGRRLVNGQEINVWQLFIRNTPLDGVYVFGPGDLSSTQPALLYTPEGPDRKSWHWFADRQAVAREWLGQDTFRAYILQRVALAERHAISRLLGSSALGSMIQARVVRNGFYDNAYRSETRLVMANADALSVSNRELNLQTTAQVAMTLIEVLCVILPGRISGVLSLSRAIWAFLQAYLAVGEESATVVLLHAFDGYANLFEATVALSTSPLFGKLARRLPLATPVPLNTHYAARQERTYLRYRLATTYAEGVYEGQPIEGGVSHYFITDRDGNRYEVVNDGEHWRVVDARMPNAMYKPIVRRSSKGDWEVVDEIRWRGINPDIPALLTRVGLPEPPSGIKAGLPTAINGRYYLRLGNHVLQVRPSLLAGRYTVEIPPGQQPELILTVIFRRTDSGRWQAKVRQGAMSSEWVTLGFD